MKRPCSCDECEAANRIEQLESELESHRIVADVVAKQLAAARESGRVEAAGAIAAWLQIDSEPQMKTLGHYIVEHNDWRAFLPGVKDGG